MDAWKWIFDMDQLSNTKQSCWPKAKLTCMGQITEETLAPIPKTTIVRFGYF